jgi:hypothetical protein
MEDYYSWEEADDSEWAGAGVQETGNRRHRIADRRVRLGVLAGRGVGVRITPILYAA